MPYGLETVELTHAEQDKLDAFQMKGLRRILKVPPTHIDREWTNKKVYELASVESGRPIQRFSDTWKKQLLKLLGHLLRTKPEDPMHQVCFEGNTKQPRDIPKRRVGRPREHWLYNTLELAHNETTPQNIEAFDCGNEHHMNWILEAANDRDDIFATKPKSSNHNPFETKNSFLNWLRLSKVALIKSALRVAP